jgi:hypothetical protein
MCYVWLSLVATLLVVRTDCSQLEPAPKSPETSIFSSIPSLSSLSASLPAFPCISSVRLQKGWCQASAQECAHEGLVADGPCAMFKDKVCCVPPLSCGAIVELPKHNGTFLANPNYPHAQTEPFLCDYKLVIPKSLHKAPVTHVRLNLIHFELSQPNESNGFCDTDALFVEGDTHATWLRLCGINTDQHLLIRLTNAPIRHHNLNDRSDTDEIKLRFVLSNGATARKWLIQVQAVARDDHFGPDHADCVQQYFGHENMIRSLNWEGHRTLHGWRYAICIRPEPGYCKLRLTAQEFQLSPINNRNRRSVSNQLNHNQSSSDQLKLSDDLLHQKSINSSESPLLDVPRSTVSTIDREAIESQTESDKAIDSNLRNTLEDAYLSIEQRRLSTPMSATHQIRSTAKHESQLDHTNLASDLCSSDQDYLQIPPAFQASSIQCGVRFNFDKPIITNLGPNLIYVNSAGNSKQFGLIVKLCLNCA